MATLAPDAMPTESLIVFLLIGVAGTALGLASWAGWYRGWVGSGWEYRYLIMLPGGLMALLLALGSVWRFSLVAFVLAMLCGLGGMVLFVLLNTPWRYRFYPRWYKREYGRR